MYPCDKNKRSLQQEKRLARNKNNRLSFQIDVSLLKIAISLSMRPKARLCMSWLKFSANRPAPPVAVLSVLALTIAGCSNIGQSTRNVASALTLYKAEVVQGNFVSKEQAAQLRSGMTRSQVRDLLGTPLITPLFEGDRWDYVFTMKRQRVDPQNYKITVYFSGDTLSRFDVDKNLPSENEFVQRISGHSNSGKVPQMRATPTQLDQFSRENPRQVASDASTAQAPIGKVYPPLESATAN
jgi:outer membrane protein assembly factor BamE